MKVSDIMTSEGLATATLDTTLAEIAARMRDENVGAIPIVDDDEKLAGIITDRDIVVRGIAEGQDPDECTAEDIISEKLHTIHPHADIEEAAELMARHQIRRLPVVENAVIVGMISLGDIAVKSEEDEAASALENISEGVREGVGGDDASGDVETDNLRETAEPVSAGRRNLGSTSRSGGVESTFAVSGQTTIEEITEDDLDSGRENPGRQLGGSRSSSSLASRLRNWSRSQQTIAHEAEALEGEDAADVISSTLVAGRERTNQQQASPNKMVNDRERSSRTESISRSSGTKPASGKTSRKDTSKNVRVEAKSQAGNRSRTDENRKAGKVTTMKSTGRTKAHSKSKRKAS
jgi:CBS domain-containing protein